MKPTLAVRLNSWNEISFYTKDLDNALFDIEKATDFGYWGRMKHGNDREKTIREIYRSELSTVMVGGFPFGHQKTI